jgi:regulator of sigma E protease
VFSFSSIIYTILIIGLLVIVHELGHFLMARLFKVTAHEFSVGFGPLLFQREWGKVKYSLRAIPLGGYCKIAGMDIALEGEPGEKPNPGEFAFYELPLYRKILIILGGPVSNILLALLIFIFVAAAVGLPDRPEERPIIGFVEPKTPAFEAGLSSGDEIVEINGEPIQRWEEVVAIIHRSPLQPLEFKIKRGEEQFSREITPFYDPNGGVGRIGIMQAYTVKRLPLSKAVPYGFASTWYGMKGVVVASYRIITGQERAGFIGPVGMVGFVDQARHQSGLLLFVMTSISLFLALFNLLPIPLPLLDGGWIVIFILERLRGKEFSPEQKGTAQMIGLLLMLVLFIMITSGDVGSIIRRLLN